MMIKFKNRIKCYIAIMVFAMMAVLALYLFVFRGGITNDITIWGNTGSFISGLLTPILASINIVVFIEISYQISKWDDRRSENDIKAQKAIVLMQFRKQEIDTFENVMNEAFLPHEQFAISLQAQARPIVFASLYIQSFLTTKLRLFGLYENDNITKLLVDLNKNIVAYNNDFVNSKGIIDKELLNQIILTKSEVIYKLQEITLKETLYKKYNHS